MDAPVNTANASEIQNPGWLVSACCSNRMAIRHGALDSALDPQGIPEESQRDLPDASEKMLSQAHLLEEDMALRRLNL